MSNSNGKITKPVDVRGDVAMVLSNGIISVAASDVAALCSHANINPASKCKPIRYPSYEALTDYNDSEDQFMGTTADNLNGIYYGVKIATGNTKWYELHDAKLEYQRVRPGTDWCRITDFNNYNHKAVFNPYGDVAEKALIGQGISVNLHYEYREDCVDIGDIIKNYVEKNTKLDLGDYYPCALVSPANKSSHYVRALQRTGNTMTAPAVSTFRVGTAYWNEWIIPVDTAAVGDNGYPGSLLTTEGGILVTIFFTKEITAARGGLDLTKWNKITSTTDQVTNYQAYACPQATGVTVQMTPMFEAGVMVTSVSGKGKRITAFVQWGKPVAGRAYTVNVEVTFPDGSRQVLSKSYTATASTNTALNPVAMTLDLLSDLKAGKYTYSWNTKWSSNPTASGSGSFTVS